MAGGKETPRQRLIGLMYIVFLALIALQVSSAIIEKFQFLNSSLEQGVANTTQLNAQKIDQIKAAVEKNPRYGDILNQAQTVKAKSEEMIAYIKGIKDEVIKETGGIDEAGHFNGAKDTDRLGELMLGPGDTKKGKGYELKRRLDTYVAEMRQLTGINFPMLAQDAKEDPLFAKDPNQRRKDFAQLNFAETPMVAGLAVLSDKQARIANMQAQVLGELASKVGQKDYKFDVIRAAYSARSSTVAAGTDYEAEMYVTATSSAIVPTMKFSGQTIQVANGVGKIKFKASAGTYDAEGNAKKTWDGSITIPKPTGDGDTTFAVKGEYVVAKPVIDVKSAAVQALYANCGNPLSVQVPALGASYKPAFSASGATLIPGTKGEVMVIPNATADKVVLNVSSEGTKIGDKDFPVRPVPRPTIVIKSGGAPVNLKTGFKAPGPAVIEVVPEPDPTFASALPKEARYRTSDGTIFLARRDRPVGQAVINGNSVNLSSMRGSAQPGDRYIIEVKKVQRKNFRDAVEDVNIPVSQGIVTVPIN